MLTEIQKATLKNLACNDPELIQFLKIASKYITAPKIFSHLLHNGIKGPQLKSMIALDHGNNPERFVKELTMKINGRII